MGVDDDGGMALELVGATAKVTWCCALVDGADCCMIFFKGAVTVSRSNDLVSSSTSGCVDVYVHADVNNIANSAEAIKLNGKYTCVA